MLLTPLAPLCHKLSHLLGPPLPLERDVLCGRPLGPYTHWRILVKNIEWANQNIGGGQKVVKSNKCMGVSQLLESKAPLSSKTDHLYFRQYSGDSSSFTAL